MSIKSIAGAVMNMYGRRNVRMSSEKARIPVLNGSARAMPAAAYAASPTGGVSSAKIPK